MKVPELDFEIPEINFSSFQVELKKQENRLKGIIKKSGKNSKSFKSVRNQLILHVKNGEINIEKYITNSLAVRALTDLWLEDVFNKRCPVTVPLINSIFSVRSYPGTISFIQLIRLFFMRFDQCGDLNSLINGILRGFVQLEKKKLPKDLNAISQCYKTIVSKNGPNWLVSAAVDLNKDLDSIQAQMGLSYYFGGRFGEICKNYYYLHQIKELQPNQSSPIFSEIQKPNVYNCLYTEGRFLGHEILSILIDKAPTADLCKEWQNLILEIAGDPRIPKTSPKYQKWWAILGEKRIEKVNGWLSKFDLLLFLEVLENYGINSGKEDLQRMFPARKKFLEGLHKQNMIQGSRLFVSSAADAYLRKNYKKSELPQYATCGGTISVIYLNIQGHHMVEGSHSFSLWIYDRLPKQATLLQYGKNKFSNRELGIGLSEQYNDEKFGSPMKHIRENISWQPDPGIAKLIIRKVTSLGSYEAVKEFYDSDSNISNYAREAALIIFDTSKEIKTDIYEHQDNNKFPINIKHMPIALNWQRKTIKAFEGLNIRIDPESVFSKEDYQEYKQRYGLTY